MDRFKIFAGDFVGAIVVEGLLEALLEINLLIGFVVSFILFITDYSIYLAKGFNLVSYIYDKIN